MWIYVLWNISTFSYNEGNIEQYPACKYLESEGTNYNLGWQLINYLKWLEVKAIKMHLPLKDIMFFVYFPMCLAQDQLATNLQE